MSRYERLFTLSARVAAVALMMGLVMGALWTPSALAEEYKGVVVSAGEGKLIVKGSDDKSKTFDIPAEAKITRDGKAAKLTDLKKSDVAIVSTDEKSKVTKVEVTSAKPEFAEQRLLLADAHEGTFISAEGGKLSMLDQDGKTKRSFALAKDAKITRDGKAAKLADLQKGDGLKVTMVGEEASIIEAKSKPKKE